MQGFNHTNWSSAYINKKLQFDATKDVVPFIVELENRRSDAAEKIHPLNIGKQMFQTGIKSVKNISPRGPKRVAIEFTNQISANLFLVNEDFINLGYKMYIPQRLVEE